MTFRIFSGREFCPTSPQSHSRAARPPSPKQAVCRIEALEARIAPAAASLLDLTKVAPSAPGADANGVAVMAASTVSVSVAGSPIAEDAAQGAVLTYTFTRTGDVSQPLTINFSAASGAAGTADFTNDYSLSGPQSGFGFSTVSGVGTLTFADGNANATVLLTPTNDTLVEGDESAVIFMNTGAGYAVGTSPAVGTISDNDSARIDFAASASNAPEGTTPHLVGVQLTTFSPEGTARLQDSFTVSVSDLGGGTATGGGTDYSFNPQSVTFSVGDTGSTKSVSATIINDTISEGNETFQLGLSSGLAELRSSHFGSSSLISQSTGIIIAGAPHTVTIVDNDVDLHVNITGPNQNPVAGSGTGNVAYTATLTNPGSTTAANIDVFVDFQTDGGIGYSSNTTQDGMLSGNDWLVPSLAPNGTATITFFLTADHTAADQSHATTALKINSADQTLINTGDDTASAQATIIRQSDLALTKTGSPDPVGHGAQLTYTITVTNSGPSDNTSAVISDPFPAAFTNSTWSASNGHSGTGNIADIAAIAAGGSVIYTAVGTVSAAPSASFTNTASLTSTEDTNSQNDSASETISVGVVDLVLTVTKDHIAADGGSLPAAKTKNLIARGQELKYTYSYSNVGTVNTSGATITAEVPTGTSFNFGDSTMGWSPGAANTYVFQLGALAPAFADSVIFSVDINPNRTLGLKAINSTATIADSGSTDPDPTPADNTAATSTTLYEGLYTVSNSRQGGVFGVGSLPFVRVFDVTTAVEAPRILAYEKTYRDGVRVAIGDINGDGFDDIVTAARSGTGRIRVFDGLTHTRLNLGNSTEINAFTGRAAHGAYVALSDVNGDGRLDIIAGSGLGGGIVKVFSGATGSLLRTETPFGAGYKGGIRVAGGDVNGDGRGDIITGQGQLGSKVTVFFGGGEGVPDPVQFTAGAPRLRDGVFLATGDVTGDGVAEIIVGRGKSGSDVGASIGMFRFALQADFAGSAAPAFTTPAPTEVKTIPLSNSTYFYGARPAATDINFDGIADIVVGAGPLGKSKVQILDGLTGAEISHLIAFPGSSTLGVWTAAGAPPIPGKRL